MTTDEIIKLAREAGFATKNIGEEITIAKHSNGLWVSVHHELLRFAALVTQAEREARQKAQAENETLKARLAHSGVELRQAVLVEREACAKVCDFHDDERAIWSVSRNCAEAIRARGEA